VSLELHQPVGVDKERGKSMVEVEGHRAAVAYVSLANKTAVSAEVR
jgi:hypothetical protein